MKNEVIKKFAAYQQEHGWKTFYRCPALNENGAVRAENIKWICDNFAGLAAIESQNRESYVVKHDGVMPQLCTNRTEEMIAMAIANAVNAGDNPFKDIALTKCEYQVPLKKDNKTGKGIGKGIDLVGVDEKSKVAFLMELKKPPKFKEGVKVAGQKEESVLRCLLEAYTYAKWVDNDAFRRDFGVKNIAICPVVFNCSRAHQEWENRDVNGISELVKMMERDGVKVHFEHLDYSKCGFRPFLVKAKSAEVPKC